MKKLSHYLSQSDSFQRVCQVIALFLFIFSVFTFISLGSFHPEDTGWLSVSGLPAVNWMGAVGAWWANVLFSLFGVISYMVAFGLTYLAWRLVRRPTLYRTPYFYLLQGMGVVLIFLGGCGLCSLFLHVSAGYFPQTAGGILGFVIAEKLTRIFSLVGGGFSLSALVLLGLTLMSGFSWVHFIFHGVQLALKLAKKMAKAMVANVTAFKNKRKKDTATLLKSHVVTKKKSSSKKKLSTIKELEEPHSSVVAGTAPSLDVALLDVSSEAAAAPLTEQDLILAKAQLEEKLADFGISAEVVDSVQGPVVTRFELQLAPGVKASRVTQLATDLARSLLVASVRVVEVISGKSTIGIELPNATRESVSLRDIFESQVFQTAASDLTLALGKGISGEAVVIDLAKMPHLLVAGTTGSGKSVGMNAMVLSLLYKSTPDNVRLIMIDPKMLELSVYEGIPHLMTPVVTDMREASQVLRWCVFEMERRYQLMSHLGVRQLTSLNDKIAAAEKSGKPLFHPQFPELQLEKLPSIVVCIDEFADMIMMVGKEVETLIARIAQKARAASIHLILATQRPSVDVITGLIKANVPSRIAFQVSSKIDSRTILDQAGAEQLLGRGDMLYLPIGGGAPIRVHGAFVTDREVHAVVSSLKEHYDPPNYIQIDAEDLQENKEKSDSENDPLYDEVVAFVIEGRKASASLIQRQFRIGYNRAARLVDTMESAGVVSCMQNGARQVLVDHHEGG